MHPSNKDTLHSQRDPSSGKTTTDSNRFPGHENRMADHIHRVWNHTCERTDGKRCGDCLQWRKR
jgi:hypothetical protein